MIRNCGSPLDWNSKTAAEDKNTRVNITVKNRVHAEYKLSLDDGNYTAGCLRGKIFMNQVNFTCELFVKHLLLQLVLIMCEKF